MSKTATNSESNNAASSRRLLKIVTMELRWRDLDAFNHVNNSSFLTYLEEARLRWLAEIAGTLSGENGAPVLASALVNYRRQLEWPNQINIELRAGRIGRSSLTIEHRIVAHDDSQVLYCDGHTVMVWIDPATGKSVPLPDALRRASTSENT